VKKGCSKQTNVRKEMFHIDRGMQYACHDFTNLLGSYSYVERRMSGKGNYRDNALAESFLRCQKWNMFTGSDLQVKKKPPYLYPRGEKPGTTETADIPPLEILPS